MLATRAERLRYVVARLATGKARRSSLPAKSSAPVSRRDSLNVALVELEGGALEGTSTIIFGREWWGQLSRSQQALSTERPESPYRR